MIRFALLSRTRTAVALAVTGLVCAVFAGPAGAASDQRRATGADRQSAAATRALVDPEFFDDFNYTYYTDTLLTQRGWTLKSGQAGPGVPGATYKPANITFATELGNKVMVLRSVSNGTAAGTEHSEIYQERKFLKGTYAARVYFRDTPIFGPDGDHIVQTFFTYSPLSFPMDPNYSELDFEYLPNGGWGIPSSALLATSWETYQESPWQAVSVTTQANGSYVGWRDLVITVDNTNIKYYVDGQLFATHSEPYLPESLMDIRFNQWLIDLTGVTSGKTRAYEEKIDYVYYAKDQVLTPAQVQTTVAAYRSAGVTFEDTV
ncbi:glycoside hydrolase family 16 protein [Streptomyces cavernae]|uniref:glycoside hydrolase family 16 protein n=1 Tax=Streptomyces cavernae TaxID=2259034 RepID=UPI000FEBED45|nr:glycoside hydrolase family 16 protein [Streptomyces cavernae]